MNLEKKKRIKGKKRVEIKKIIVILHAR